MRREKYKKLVDRFTGELLDLALNGAPFAMWSTYYNNFMESHKDQLSDRRKADLYDVYFGLWSKNQQRNAVFCYQVKDVDGVPDGIYTTRKNEGDRYNYTMKSGRVLKTTEHLHDLKLPMAVWDSFEKITINNISEVLMN